MGVEPMSKLKMENRLQAYSALNKTIAKSRPNTIEFFPNASLIFAWEDKNCVPMMTLWLSYRESDRQRVGAD